LSAALLYCCVTAAFFTEYRYKQAASRRRQQRKQQQPLNWRSSSGFPILLSISSAGVSRAFSTCRTPKPQARIYLSIYIYILILYIYMYFDNKKGIFYLPDAQAAGVYLSIYLSI
jgi:hypothetical protein